MTTEKHIDLNVLLSAMKADQVMAFDQLYFHFAPILYQRIFRLLKSPENVEEVLQEVFLKIWNMRDQLEADKGFTTLLFRMCDNLAIDHFRKSCRERSMQDELWASSISYYMHTEEAIFSKEKLQILDEAIQGLSPKRKEILLLCNIENKSYKEVASQLGISVSTVSNQLVSAMKDIKNYIQRNYKNEYLVFFWIFFH